VLDKAKDGSVVLLPDGGGDREATVQALPLILDGLAQQGLQIVGPEEATGLSREQLLPAAPRAPAAALVAGADSLVFGFLGGVARFLGPAVGFAIGLPGLRVLATGNGGKASALNLGFAEARGEVIVALDSDTLFARDTVERLVAPFADPRVGAVSGNAKVGNRVNRLTRWQSLEYITAQNLERRAWDLAGAVPVVPGAVGAWRRSAVLAEARFPGATP